jgi:hypothetical protein
MKSCISTPLVPFHGMILINGQGQLYFDMFVNFLLHKITLKSF